MMNNEEYFFFTEKEKKNFLQQHRKLRKENEDVTKHLEEKKKEFDRQINAQAFELKKQLANLQSNDPRCHSSDQSNNLSSQEVGRNKTQLGPKPTVKLPSIECPNEEIPQKQSSCIKGSSSCSTLEVLNNKQRPLKSPRFCRRINSLKGDNIALLPTLRRGSLPGNSTFKSHLSNSVSHDKGELFLNLPSAQGSGSHSLPGSPLLSRRRCTLAVVIPTSSISANTTPQNSPPVSPHMTRNLAMRERRRRASLRGCTSEDEASSPTDKKSFLSKSLEEQFKDLESCRYLRN